MEYTTSSDGTLIAYARSGSGPPLVLVHGTTADHTRWARVQPDLERICTVIAMDRRGRGASGDATDYAIEREYDDVAAVVEAAGKGATLLGHSFGALCAMEAALRIGSLKRLILYEPPFPVGSTPLYTPETRERLEQIFYSGDREEFLRIFFRDVVHMPEAQLAATQADPYWKQRVASAHTVLREMADGDYNFKPTRFRDLAIPTLLLLGEKSPPEFSEPTRILDEVLPNSRISLLDGQGHVAMTTAPELFVREVMTFIAD